MKALKPVKLLCLLFHGSVQDLSLEIKDEGFPLKEISGTHLIQLLSHICGIGRCLGLGLLQLGELQGQLLDHGLALGKPRLELQLCLQMCSV